MRITGYPDFSLIAKLLFFLTFLGNHQLPIASLPSADAGQSSAAPGVGLDAGLCRSPRPRLLADSHPDVTAAVSRLMFSAVSRRTAPSLRLRDRKSVV